MSIRLTKGYPNNFNENKKEKNRIKRSHLKIIYASEFCFNLLSIKSQNYQKYFGNFAFWNVMH